MSNTVWTLAWSYRGLDRVNYITVVTTLAKKQAGRDHCALSTELCLHCADASAAARGCGYMYGHGPRLLAAVSELEGH